MKIDLTNKYIFWSIILSVVVVLTTVNNYYFYQYMKYLSVQDSIKLKKQLELIAKDCDENNITNSICERFLIDSVYNWSSRSIYNRSLQLTTHDGEITHIKDLAYKRAIGSNIKIDIGLFFNSNPNAYQDNSQEDVSLIQILPTVYRSITLSLGDVYKSLTKENKATADGKIVDLENRYIIIEHADKTMDKIKINKYDTLYVKNGDIVKAKQLLVVGNIHSALNTFTRMFPRSRPFLGYLLIVFILLTISKKREVAYQNSIALIEEEKEKVQKQFEEEIRKINDEAAKKLDTFKKIEEEENHVCKQFSKFDNILNPPVNTINIKDLLNSNLNFVGTAFRQVLEKIIFKIYDDNMADRDPKINLGTAIYTLEKKNIITKQLAQTLHAVRIYGNDFTHYSDKSATKTEALVAAMNLLSILEEIESIYIDTPTQTKKQSGLKIVKKAEKR